MDEVTESESILTIQSCADRCQEAAPKKRGRGPINHQVQCDCDKGCISVGTCCPDYVDVCDEPEDVTKTVSTVILDYDVIIPGKCCNCHLS